MPLPKTMPKRKPSKDDGRVYANRYKVVRRLGSGNFGTVFLVEDMSANRERKCLKEIYIGELHPDEAVDAMKEARLLSELTHPNVVKFMDSFPDKEMFCIVTEYCEGGDLGEKIHAWKKAGKTFSESLIIAWFIQIVLAVQFMHSKRVLHRDLKTRNIFLKNNMIKLGDFGISRILMGTSDMATTFTGTPYYMSPEVLKHEAYNHKSDIWSLGAILYEMCNLEHPFQGQNLMGIMYKIIEGDPPKLSTQYSSELQKLYERLLAKDPSKRPSGSEIVKFDFIASNMKKLSLQMQDKLSVKDSFKAKGGQHPISVERPVTRSGRNGGPKLYEEPEERPMTPLDKMKLRKMKKADEEAERIKQFMANQGSDAQAQYMSHKKKQNQVSLPWVDDHPEVFQDPHFTFNKQNSVENRRPVGFSSENVPLQGNGNNRTWANSEEDNPYDLTVVSDIPEDATLAETYYSQFEDEFEASDSDTSDNCDNEETLKYTSDDEEDDFSALVNQMENALEYSATELDSSLSDEIVGGQALSMTMREQRMTNLRKECIKLLGEDEFQKVYIFLKDARFGEEFQNEESIVAGLGKIVKNPRDCFLVDQLLFMEKQAEIAVMTQQQSLH
ncbi:serine/threonine-protein kinase Nek11-like [Actinia tenebrosa]|uniref:non-specific serine/threonine protein kinase n=1 Tax=Actinia tenebrosa TaxID=6105 RepID=A0A6P8HAG5_ACTTE|nr:serine/threonine-protein kinase Nek11-like [Actinia tenebrosa]